MEAPHMTLSQLHNDVLALVEWVAWARGLAGGALYSDDVSPLDVCNRIHNDGRIDGIIASYSPVFDESHVTVQPYSMRKLDKSLTAAVNTARALSGDETVNKVSERDDEFYSDMAKHSDR